MKLGTKGCPETSVSNHLTLCNSPEDRRLLHCRYMAKFKLKSKTHLFINVQYITCKIYTGLDQ